jgi:hypothetical protein
MNKNIKLKIDYKNSIINKCVTKVENLKNIYYMKNILFLISIESIFWGPGVNPQKSCQKSTRMTIRMSKVV